MIGYNVLSSIKFSTFHFWGSILIPQSFN